MVFFVAGSAFTVVFWTKWVGRLLVGASGGAPPRAESMRFLYRTQLGLLTVAAIVLSLAVWPIMNYLIVPYVSASAVYGAAGGFVTDNPGALVELQSTAGGFPFVALFIAIVSLFALTTIMVQFRRPVHVQPYLCGENAAELPEVSFRSPMDAPQTMTVGGYYFDRLFGESRHTRWINFAAVLLLLLLFGIAFK